MSPAVNVLIDRYGDGALLRAVRRIAALLDKGNMDSRAMWLRIQAAVLELLKEEPQEGAEMH